MTPEDALSWATPRRARATLVAWPPRFRGRLRTVNVGENATFRLAAPAGVLALRLYRPGRWSDEEIRVEHAFMSHLGVRQGVMPPVPGRNGETLQLLPDGSRAALFPWAPGRTAGRPGRGLLRRVGAYLARMHRACTSFEVPGPRVRWGAETLLHVTREHLRYCFRRLLPGRRSPRLGAALAAGERLWKGLELPEAMIHADFHWGNLKLDGGGMYPLDFDDCGVGPLAYDLCTVTYCTALCREREGVELLVEAYNREADHPTTAEVVDLLTWARFVWLAGWILERPELFPGGALEQRLRVNLANADVPGRRLGIPSVQLP